MTTPISSTENGLAITVPTLPPAEDLYPETDGRPMGETDLHQEWMWKLKQILKHRDRETGEIQLMREDADARVGELEAELRRLRGE